MTPVADRREKKKPKKKTSFMEESKPWHLAMNMNHFYVRDVLSAIGLKEKSYMSFT